MKFRIGDLVRIIEDPSSFFVRDDDIGQVGIIIEYDDLTKVYLILISGNNKIIKALDYMLETT